MLFIEQVGLLEVFRIQDPRLGIDEEFLPENGAYGIIDESSKGCRDREEDQHDEKIQLPGASRERPDRKQQGIAGQERCQDHPALREDDQEKQEVNPDPELVDEA